MTSSHATASATTRFRWTMTNHTYRLATASETIAVLPVHWSLDDWEQYAFLPAPQVGSVITAPSTVLGMWCDELDAMRRYRCLFNLCVHPFLSGRPSRIVALRQLIEFALDRGDVHFARCREVAEATLADPALPIRHPAPPQAALDVFPR